MYFYDSRLQNPRLVIKAPCSSFRLVRPVVGLGSSGCWVEISGFGNSDFRGLAFGVLGLCLRHYGLGLGFRAGRKPCRFEGCGRFEIQVQSVGFCVYSSGLVEGYHEGPENR